MQKYWFTRNAIIKLLKSQILSDRQAELSILSGRADKEFIIGTECGVLTKLKERRPDAEFYFPETTPTCVNMKKITPEKVLHVLKTGENEIHAKPETEGAAKNALARMLELAGK